MNYANEETIQALITEVKSLVSQVTNLIQAVNVSFTPGASGLQSTSVQAALLEINGKLAQMTSGIYPKGTIAFANLPALASAGEGDMYNISTDFTTTADFTTPNVAMKAGSNVYCCLVNGAKKWDVFAVTPSVVVDQVYNGASANPQSGAAIAGKVADLNNAIADAKNRPVLLTTENLVQGGLWIG